MGEVVHFDFFYLGDSEVERGSDELDGYAYVLVLLEDVSGYIWLAPAKACTASFTARQLVTWSAVFGTPKVRAQLILETGSFTRRRRCSTFNTGSGLQTRHGPKTRWNG